MAIHNFLNFCLYKHKNNTDVAFEPVESTWNDDGCFLTIRWWNITNPESWKFVATDNIFIKREDLPNWESIAYQKEDFDQGWNTFNEKQKRTVSEKLQGL